jgi:archaellum component FlaC
MEIEMLQQIIAKAERIERRLDQVHLELVDVRDGMDRVIVRLSAADQRLERLDTRLERIERRVEAMI